MLKIKYIMLLALVLSAFGCDQLDISPEQADSFVKMYGTSNSEIGKDIKQFNEGYIILATVTAENGYTNIVLIQVDKYGNPLNGTDTLSTVRGGNNQASKMQLTSDGGFIVVGTVEDTVGVGQTDIYVGKFNSSAENEWEKIIGDGSSNETGNTIKKSHTGYIIAGSTDAEGEGNGNAEGIKDIYLVKIDDSGNVEWAENHGGAGDDYATDIIVIGTGYLLVGTTSSFNEPGQAKDNIIVVQTNQYGGSPDYLTYGSSNNDYGSSLIQIDDGGYLIIGTVENSVGDNSNIFATRVEEDIHDIVWEKEFEANLGLGYEVIKSNGGYIIVGSTGLVSGTAGYFKKIDGDGNELTENIYGGYGQAINAIEPTYGGGFIMVGSSGPTANEMIYVLKVNSEGEL